MAYVIVDPGAEELSLSLEGRPLRHGDALWVPVNPDGGALVRDWLPAVFVDADAREATITVAMENRARLSLSMNVGVRRRDQPGA